MVLLEDLEKEATWQGILSNQDVTVVDVDWHGSDLLELTCKGRDGDLGSLENADLYRVESLQ